MYPAEYKCVDTTLQNFKLKMHDIRTMYSI